MNSKSVKFNNLVKSDLSKKILAGFPIIVAIITVFILFMTGLQRMSDSRYNEMFEKNRIITEISSNAESMTNSLNQFLLTKDSASLERAHDSINTIERLSYGLRDYEPDSQSNMMMLDIANLSSNMIDYANLSVLAKLNRQTKKCMGYYDKVSELCEYITAQSNVLNTLLLDETNLAFEDFQTKVGTIFTIEIILFVLLLVESGLFIVMYLGQLIDPIVQMIDTAKQISDGKFNTPDVECDSTDEVGLLARTFNKMKKDIAVYLEKIEKQRGVEKELYEKKTENIQMQMMLQDANYTALSSQIQPHFLFNTINTGMQIAYREGADDTVEFFDNMSGLLRYNLRNTKSPVTLKQELEQLERYLYLLKQRFGDILNYEFIIETDEHCLDNIGMPSTILQPLVENSFMHGFRDSNRKGMITICVYENDNHAIVNIHDNGKGVSEEELEKIRNGVAIKKYANDNVGSTGIGLNNVRERLKSFFGREDVMLIDSKEDEYFDIILQLNDSKGTEGNGKNEITYHG